MTRYVAILRAVSVGGIGKPPMADLEVLCIDVGLDCMQTYIARGNVMFTSNERPGAILSHLEQCLQRRYGGASVFASPRDRTAQVIEILKAGFDAAKPKYPRARSHHA